MALNLPFDILAEIIGWCPTSELLTFRLTGKALVDISDSRLYRNISINCYYGGTSSRGTKVLNRIIRLYNILRDNRSKAALVKRLELKEVTYVPLLYHVWNP